MERRSGRFADLDQTTMLRINQLCNEAEERWQRGENVELEELIAELPGLARFEDRNDPHATDLTKSNMVMGTAAYMPPEQARDVRSADQRSDIYSLGCTFCYLLTGHPPFVEPTVLETIVAHQTETMPRLADRGLEITPHLELVFQKMVATDPAKRFQTAAEVAAALRPALGDTLAATQILANPAISSEQSSTDQHKQKSLDRRLAIAGVLGAVGIGTVGLTAWLVSGQEEEPAEPSSDSTSQETSRGLAFNGRSSFVSVPSLRPVSGNSYTIEAWAEPWVSRVSNIVSWLGPDWMALYLDARSHWGIARRVGTNSVLFAAQQPSLNRTLVHIAGVFDGGQLRLFIAGRVIVLEAIDFRLSETSGGLFVGGVPLNLLPSDQNDRFFNGLIRSVRISRGIRYREEFAPPPTLSADSTTLAALNLTTTPNITAQRSDGRTLPTRVVDATPSLDVEA